MKQNPRFIGIVFYLQFAALLLSLVFLLIGARWSFLAGILLAALILDRHRAGPVPSTRLPAAGSRRLHLCLT
jgi:hypothetical protein